MISVVVAVLLSQAVGPECISVGGQRVCGYHCLQTPSGGACAQTPDGLCKRGDHDQLRCFDPPLFLKRVYGDKLPAPTCVSRGMNMACGYHCASDGDVVGCAKTPFGQCIANWSKVTCFDPPVEVYGVYGTKLPETECIARGRQLACGYHCTAGGDPMIGCSKTPFGTCAEKGGSVTCFDPDKYVICSMGKATPKPECVYQSGNYTCGYDCKIALGLVGCAKTPAGTCNAEGTGQPVCFDPPVRGGDGQCVELIGYK